MGVLDFVISIIWFFTILAIALIYFNFSNTNSFDKKWGLIGILGKMSGAVAFLLIYTFYFNRLGDTFAYLGFSKHLYVLITEKPIMFFEIFSPNSETKSFEFYQYIKYIDFYSEWDTYTVILFSAIISFLSFGEPFATTVIFSAISFTGLWQLYTIISKIFPKNKKEALIATLFVPSVIFWGSGVLKDTLVIGFLGFFLNAFFSIFQFNEYRFKNWFWLIISPAIIALIKPYIILSLIPAFLFYFLALTTKRVKNIVVKFVFLPIVVALVSGASIYSIVKIGEFFPQYSTDNILKTAEKYQLNHYAGGNRNAEGAGSGYSLGDYEASFIGVMFQIPLAINVTLFRPYLWEIRNFGMLISAFESFIFLVLSIFILIKSGLGFSINQIERDPFLVFSTILFLFFAFAVGFSSYNFGALARYKIPCLPFFVFTLLFIYQKSKNEQRKAAFLRR